VLGNNDGSAFAVELDETFSSRRTAAFGVIDQLVSHAADQWLVVVPERLTEPSLSRLDSPGTLTRPRLTGF
jgi:hypothetical protein